jgi:hypothetical protein
MLSAFPAMAVDCDDSENDCGGKGVLHLLDIRVRRPTEYGADNRPRDCPADTKDFLKTVLCKPDASI